MSNFDWWYSGWDPSIVLGSSGPQRVSADDPDPDYTQPRLRGFGREVPRRRRPVVVNHPADPPPDPTEPVGDRSIAELDPTEWGDQA